MYTYMHCTHAHKTTDIWHRKAHNKVLAEHIQTHTQIHTHTYIQSHKTVSQCRAKANSMQDRDGA